MADRLSDQAFMDALGLNVEQVQDAVEEDLKINMMGKDYE